MCRKEGWISVLAQAHPRVFSFEGCRSLTRFWAPEGNTSVWLASVSSCPGLAHMGAQDQRVDRCSLQPISEKAVGSCGKWQACQAVRVLNARAGGREKSASYLRPAPPLVMRPLEKALTIALWDEKRTGTFRDTSSPFLLFHSKGN